MSHKLVELTEASTYIGESKQLIDNVANKCYQKKTLEVKCLKND